MSSLSDRSFCDEELRYTDSVGCRVKQGWLDDKTAITSDYYTMRCKSYMGAPVTLFPQMSANLGKVQVHEVVDTSLAVVITHLSDRRHCIQA